MSRMSKRALIQEFLERPPIKDVKGQLKLPPWFAQPVKGKGIPRGHVGPGPGRKGFSEDTLKTLPESRGEGQSTLGPWLAAQEKKAGRGIVQKALEQRTKQNPNPPLLQKLQAMAKAGGSLSPEVIQAYHSKEAESRDVAPVDAPVPPSFGKKLTAGTARDLQLRLRSLLNPASHGPGGRAMDLVRAVALAHKSLGGVEGKKLPYKVLTDHAKVVLEELSRAHADVADKVLAAHPEVARSFAGSIRHFAGKNREVWGGGGPGPTQMAAHHSARAMKFLEQGKFTDAYLSSKRAWPGLFAEADERLGQQQERRAAGKERYKAGELDDSRGERAFERKKSAIPSAEDIIPLSLKGDGIGAGQVLNRYVEGNPGPDPRVVRTLKSLLQSGEDLRMMRGENEKAAEMEKLLGVETRRPVRGKGPDPLRELMDRQRLRKLIAAGTFRR